MFLAKKLDASEEKSFIGSFVRELGLVEQKNSNYFNSRKFKLQNQNLIKSGESFQVLVVGGSHIESALVRVDRAGFQPLFHKKLSLENIATSNQFYKIVSDNLEKSVSFVSLVLSHDLELIQTKNGTDAKLNNPSKDHQFKGLIGVSIKDFLKKKIEIDFGRKVVFSISNDNLSLAKAVVNRGYSNQCVVTGVVASGVNFGIFDDNGEFTNLETGCFNSDLLSDSTVFIDKLSSNPNKHLLEKEIGSKYLHEHFNCYAQKNNLPKRCVNLSDFEKACYSKDVLVKAIAQSVLSRSAQLVACKIASFVKYKRFSKLKFVVEGSLLWDTPNYYQLVLGFLKKMGYSKLVQLVRIRDSFLVGAVGFVACIVILPSIFSVEGILQPVEINFLFAAHSPPIF